MKVHGYTLPPEIEEKALEWMRGQSEFRTVSLAITLFREGVTAVSNVDGHDMAFHCADDLIQRERNAGNISQTHGRGLWSWGKKEEAA